MKKNKVECMEYKEKLFPCCKYIIAVIAICLIFTFVFNEKSVKAADSIGDFALQNVSTGDFASQNALVGDSASQNVFDSEYINSVIELIKSKYAGEVDDKELLEGALKGIFGTMDPYTGFYSEEEAEQFFGDVEGSYEGIGISIEAKDDTIIVSKVFNGSPAEKAGLIQGDRIISVDTKSIIGVSADEASSLIRGQAGTKVVLSVMRSNSGNVISIEVERQKIKLNPVVYEIKDNIGYIKIEMFNANTEEFLNQALEEFDSKGISKIILDLRDNPGGLVDQGVALARKFVPKGLITKLIFKSEETPDQEYYSYLTEPKYKLVVLVNGMSASASEIVAGAIQDTKSGILVGTKTFGKAKVQSMLPILTPEAYSKYSDKTGGKVVGAYDLISKYNINPLNNEIIGWTKMTTGVYVTPNDRMIDGEGITPDVIVEDPPVVDGIYLSSVQKLTLTWKPSLNDEGTDVYNAEKILKILGYDIDAPDSYLDGKTSSQISKFRTDRGFFAGEVLDFTTQKALNEEYEKILNKLDKQYEKALEMLKQ